jgi:transposase
MPALEANAAMRSIVRRDTGERYEEFLTRLAKASGIGTPTRADLARLDRKRKKKASNDDWTHPHDPDAKITKMKDGRTHRAHKATQVCSIHALRSHSSSVAGCTSRENTIQFRTARSESVNDEAAEDRPPHRGQRRRPGTTSARSCRVRQMLGVG